MRRRGTATPRPPRRPRLAVFLAAAAMLVIPATGIAQAAEPAAGQPPRFEETAFDDLLGSQTCRDPKPLEDVLQQVPGFQRKIVATKSHNQSVCQMSGMSRWKPTWPAGTALRLSIVPSSEFQIHLWRGAAGVTLRYHDDPFKVWAAFATTREEGKPEPAQAALLGTDNGRYRRSGCGTFELHWSDGQLVMTRGDVRLLTVPLASPPSEVYFDGTAIIHGLQQFEVQGLPPDWDAAQPERQQVELTAAAWQPCSTEGYSLEKLPDGGIQLSAAEKTPDGQTSIRVGEPDLYEFVFQVDNPEPGTGIFLADREGRPLGRVAFLRDTKTKQTTFGMLRADQRDVDRGYDDRRLPVPWTGPRPWLRVTVGGSMMKVWVSPDGVHWSLPDPAVQEFQGGCCRFGLYCFGGDQPRAIRLRSLSFRRLDALAAQVPESLLERVRYLDTADGRREEDRLARSSNIENWRQRVAERMPPDVEPSLWQQACAVQTLRDGPSIWWPAPVLDGLVRAGLEATDDLERQFQLLDEAALLMNCSDWSAVDRWVGCYEVLGRTLEDRRAVDPLPIVQRRMISSPFWAERMLPVISERLLWYDLMGSLAARRWEDAAAVCRRLRYLGRLTRFNHENPPYSAPTQRLLDAVEMRIATRVEHLAPDRARETNVDARHPLIEQWSKEGYNVMTEFRAAMAGGSYREACQIVTSCNRSAMDGLLPDDKDPRLLISLPVLISRSLDESAPLRTAMQEHFDPLGRLRLKQAVAAGDVAAVDAIATQFSGSSAAAEADRWLGDRHLSGGRFARAEAHYRLALPNVDPLLRDELLARISLAQVMQGRVATDLPQGDVAFGARRLGSSDFRKLLDEMRQAHVGSQQPASPGALACPPPGQYEAKSWTKIEGAGAGHPDGVSSNDLDWAARETAVVVADQHMIVSNRTEQIGFDLADGKRAWYYRQTGKPSPSGWPLAAVPPVLAEGRIFIRRQSEAKPELACLQVTTGESVYSASPDDRIVSDLLVVGRRAWVLSVHSIEGQKSTLLLVQIDPATGQPLDETPLVEFQGFLNPVAPCQAAVIDDAIVAGVGGTLFCCDFSGRVRWLRRLAWFAPPGRSIWDAAPWVRQIAGPPLAAGGKVFATQPGSWSVECCDLRTGRLAWRTTLSGLVGLVGLVDDRLIVMTDDALLGLDLRSGAVLWRHDTGQRLAGRLVGAPGGLLYAQRRPSADAAKQKEPDVVLVWLDPASGRPRGESVLNTPRHEKPLLGPLVTDGKRLWAFFGVSDDSARREVFELVPAAAE